MSDSCVTGVLLLFAASLSPGQMPSGTSRQTHKDLRVLVFRLPVNVNSTETDEIHGSFN